MTSNQPIKHYPLSSPQRDIWFDQILHPDVPLYNIGGYVRIDGPIEPARFEKALNQIIAENDALRIILHDGESLPTQTFAENVHIKLDFHDFSAQENAHESALKWMKQEFVKPFQLYDGLLFQFALCKSADNCYYWLKKYHHLIIDGWGISLIVQRVAAAYNALVTGQTREPQYYSYQDFIQNEQVYLDSEKFVQAKRYWQEKYREVPEPLFVRRYTAHKSGKTIPSQRSTLRLKRTLYNQLIDFALKNHVSTFHIILGVLYCYFARTCAREDLVIGLPTLNRNTAVFKQTVGRFMGVSPVWFRFGTDLSFVELVEKIRQELQKDYRHQRFPVGEINRQVGRHSCQQLFDIMLSYAKQNYDVDFNGNSAKTVYTTAGFEQNALDIFIEEFHQQDDVNIYFDYNLVFFDEDEMERLKARFEFLLGEILRQPSVSVRELQIMPNAELKKILVEWNNTAIDYPRDKTIVDLFEEQVAKTPDAIAVVFENQQLTYLQLNSKANQLAHYLRTLGVKPEVLVGICVERSVTMVVGLLGILKAGGAYVPLDPAYPVARLAFMLEDAELPILLTQSSLKKKLPEIQALVVCLDVEAKTLSQFAEENLVREVTPMNLAYVIYTSGSTGKPKGVLIPHQGLLNLVFWHQQAFEVTVKDKSTQLASMAFDAHVWELWPYLSAGASIYLIGSETIKSPVALQNWLVETKITICFIPTPLAEELLRGKWPKNLALRMMLTGGDKLHHFPPSSLGFKLVNNYGPTENTVVTTSGLVRDKPENRPPHIGCSIANTQVYILDNHQMNVPIGVPGELHIGAVGLARGYLNRPDLTGEKFRPNPFSDEPGSRLYKTGDLARYLPDGNIEYLGRIDHQVKIRGFRIELGEIEAVLAQHPSVQQNAVIVHKASKTDKRLVAYLRHQGQLVENTALRDFLRERLPNYMVPSAFITLENLPLTANGKIDRRALSQLSVSNYQLSEKTFVAPRTPNEALLAHLWSKLLGVKPVGVYDDFFELGGHSLLARQVLSRLREHFGVEISLRELFETPTIAELVQHLNNESKAQASPVSSPAIQPISRQPNLPLSSFQESLWLPVQMNPEIPFYNESAAIHINN
jgi:amino acid adenylation domain-containing protein